MFEWSLVAGCFPEVSFAPVRRSMADGCRELFPKFAGRRLTVAENFLNHHFAGRVLPSKYPRAGMGKV